MENHKDFMQSQLELTLRMGQIYEYQDRDMGGHGIKVACYSKIIGESLNLDKDVVESIFVTTPLHDIGLIKVPNSILLKKEILTFEEWDLLREHCKTGEEIISKRIEGIRLFYEIGGLEFDPNYDSKADSFLSLASKISLTHHEWWNGKGYPNGLSKDQIPFESRLVALADAYDELTSKRPYRPGIPEEEALNKIKKNVGIQFDPELYAGFEKSIERLSALRKKFLENDQNNNDNSD
jgi:putative two-component system response regulator